MAKVSIIIPAYNSQQFIAETLDSLLRQTLKDIEVIIVNDGSTDDTQKIIDEYASKYDIFVPFAQKNAGVSAARNFGLEQATGEYVVFLDADDYYSDGSLEAFYNTAKKTDADIVIGRLATFGDGKDVHFNEYADKIAHLGKVDTFDKLLLWNFLVGNKCYKRDRLVESGVRFPAYRYCEEGAFFMSYVYTGAKISSTFDSEMYYRRHTAEQGLSVSQTVNEQLVKSFSGALKMIYDGAKNAVKKAGSAVDKDAYLQEIIYKNAHVLISQFYRLMWHGDDECAKYCAKEFERLRLLMTKETFAKICAANNDLHLESICPSKQAAAVKPDMSVIIGKCKGKNMTAFFNSLYDQISPLFEVIVPKSMADEGRIPKEYLENANLVIINDKSYMKNAKRAAKSKRVVVFRNPTFLDLRTFRMIHRIPLPDAIKTLFFPIMIKAINFILVKKIIK
ncbi:MAG: glycosyltransferase [Faecalibacterium sp.]|nr:glycosyltransferase [Ruminococcus sp.]MCM1392335.1 glycosyltransferase [Ruminococcus sp.]MCM1486040.1 glycosyltransferase [Faecalibacterium sp.]